MKWLDSLFASAAPPLSLKPPAKAPQVKGLSHFKCKIWSDFDFDGKFSIFLVQKVFNSPRLRIVHPPATSHHKFAKSYQIGTWCAASRGYGCYPLTCFTPSRKNTKENKKRESGRSTEAPGATWQHQKVQLPQTEMVNKPLYLLSEVQ